MTRSFSIHRFEMSNITTTAYNIFFYKPLDKTFTNGFLSIIKPTLGCSMFGVVFPWKIYIFRSMLWFFALCQSWLNLLNHAACACVFVIAVNRILLIFEGKGILLSFTLIRSFFVWIRGISIETELFTWLSIIFLTENIKKLKQSIHICDIWFVMYLQCTGRMEASLIWIWMMNKSIFLKQKQHSRSSMNITTSVRFLLITSKRIQSWKRIGR